MKENNKIIILFPSELANIFSEQYFRRGDTNGTEEDWYEKD